MRAFIFPGQGSQSVGMGAALAEASRQARAVFDEVDEALGQNLSRLMAEGPAEELMLTENAQPAIMANALATLARLGHRPRRPRPISSPATALANIRRCARPARFDLATTARLLKTRGQAMQAAVPVGEGAMAALLGADLAIAQAVAEAAAQGEVCTVANDNDPSQVVISGHKGAIERALEIAKEKGAKRAILLPVSAPFHCPLMQPAADAMAEALAAAQMEPPAVSLYANVTAAPVDSPDTIRDLLVEQVTGHGPLARERRRHGGGGRHPFRRVRRQGARPDGQAHRARTSQVTSVVTMDDIDALVKEI